MFIKAYNSSKLTMQQRVVKCTPDVPFLAPITESPQLACQGEEKNVYSPLITNTNPSNLEAITERLCHIALIKYCLETH